MMIVKKYMADCYSDPAYYGIKKANAAIENLQKRMPVKSEYQTEALFYQLSYKTWSLFERMLPFAFLTRRFIARGLSAVCSACTKKHQKHSFLHVILQEKPT